MDEHRPKGIPYLFIIIFHENDQIKLLNSFRCTFLGSYRATRPDDLGDAESFDDVDRDEEPRPIIEAVEEVMSVPVSELESVGECAPEIHGEVIDMNRAAPSIPFVDPFRVNASHRGQTDLNPDEQGTHRPLHVH